MNLVKLKFLYLSHCYYLKSTPNLSGFNNLEELLLNDCIRLVEIDESIGCLDKLLVLDLKNCKHLQTLPSSIWMLKSLECLDLSGSSKLENLFGFRGSSSSSYLSYPSSGTLRTKSVGSIQGLCFLKKLNMAKCNLSYLPSEIGNLVSLTKLVLYDNCNLCALPDSIGNLMRLEDLQLAYCNLSDLPREIGKLVSLMELNLMGNRNLCAVPDSIGNLTRLEELRLSYCNLSYLPSEIGRLISLMNLDLKSNDNLRTVPNSICDLSCLKDLVLDGCNLSHLPIEIGRLSSLERLYLAFNKNLRTVPDSICDLSCLKNLSLADCNLSHLPSEIGRMTSLDALTLNRNNFRSLPEGIGNLTRLVYLALDECANLHSLPQLPSSFATLRAYGCTSLQNSSSDCQQLIVNSFANNLRKDLPLIVGQFVREPLIRIFLSGDEVPRWLMYQSTGSCLFFEVPPLDNRKILGFMLGAVYSFCRYVGLFNILIFNNKTKGVVSCPVRSWVTTRGICADGGLIESQLLLTYVPLCYLRMHFEGGDEVEISMRLNKVEYSGNFDEGAIVMKKWGMNLLYKVEE